MNDYVQKNKWIERFYKIGYAAKGAVYAIVGILILVGNFTHEGNKTAGRSDVLQTLAEQSYGTILLLILGLGLICYSLWRLYAGIANAKNKDDDAQGIGMRIGYIASGVIYGFFAYLALKYPFGAGGGGGAAGGSGGGTRETLIATLMGSTWGQIILWLVVIGTVLSGIKQIYSAIKEKYMESVDESELSSDERKAYRTFGEMGYWARGIIFLIIGYFLARAILEHSSEQFKSTGEVFSYIYTLPAGQWLALLLAFGVLLYGLFALVKAKYSSPWG